jgi:hypothetical protein
MQTDGKLKVRNLVSQYGTFSIETVYDFPKLADLDDFRTSFVVTEAFDDLKF